MRSSSSVFSMASNAKNTSRVPATDPSYSKQQDATPAILLRLADWNYCMGHLFYSSILKNHRILQPGQVKNATKTIQLEDASPNSWNPFMNALYPTWITRSNVRKLFWRFFLFHWINLQPQLVALSPLLPIIISLSRGRFSLPTHYIIFFTMSSPVVCPMKNVIRWRLTTWSQQSVILFFFTICIFAILKNKVSFTHVLQKILFTVWVNGISYHGHSFLHMYEHPRR